MRIKYLDKKLGSRALDIVAKANAIIVEYQEQGFDLTLRQLYYQFVSRDFIANKQKEYKRLGNIINDARLAGLIDWTAIVDRTRNLQAMSHWASPSEIVEACVQSFRMDKWEGQEYRIEVWIEKDALTGVIDGICRELDVPYFSCRGYTSQSEMWSASQRLDRYKEAGHTPIIIHLGDHDPSGIDMTRDIFSRMELFIGGVKVERIALNMNQVEKYNPPPNPCKLTDPRSGGYQKEHGNESWELDALDPKTIAKLIEKTVKKYRDDDKLEDVLAEESKHRKSLVRVAKKLD